MERKRQKLVGQDKGSFTEKQNKGKNSNNNDTDKENTQNNRMHKATLTTAQCRVHAPEPRLPSRRPAFPQPEPSMRAHGMEYPVLSGQGGSAHLAGSPPCEN